MHPTYQDLVVDRASRMVSAAQAVQKIKHSGLRGTLRELVVRDLLFPLLPPQFLVGSGEIISSYEQTSSQTDVIIADRRILPAMLIDNVSGVFPVESALVTIEVKSVLNASELSKSEQSAARLKDFMHAPPVRGVPGEKPIEHVVPYVFAFDTDLTSNGMTETDRYDKLLNGASPSIKGLCVVGRGFWFQTPGGWINWQMDTVHPEVVAFIAALVNTVERIASTRQQPDMRSYVM